MNNSVEVIVDAMVGQLTGQYFVAEDSGHPDKFTEIIRCEDCKYYKEAPLLTYCGLHSMLALKAPTSKYGFCDKAKRKNHGC